MERQGGARWRAARSGVAGLAALLVVCALVPSAPVWAQESRFQGKSLDEWQGDLTKPDPRLRRRATAALGNFGAAALPSLTQALTDPDAEVRLAAVRGIGRLGPGAQAAQPALVAAMKDRSGIVRRVAAIALGEARQPTPEVIDALIRALADPDAAVVDNAAHSLLDLGPPAVPALSRALKDTDAAVRAGAVVTLTAGVQFGQFRPVPAETVAALMDALKDTEPDIRDEAARSLAEVGPAAKPALGPLREMAQGDPVDSVRRTAQRAIERLESN